uniref:Uncharacterized protein n=1 Tax=Alexandrium catenella TaxID=2925 RepID=A0A7S1WT43_ALECA
MEEEVAEDPGEQARKRKCMRTQGLLALAGLIMIVSAFACLMGTSLPWFTVRTETVKGAAIITTLSLWSRRALEGHGFSMTKVNLAVLCSVTALIFSILASVILIFACCRESKQLAFLGSWLCFGCVISCMGTGGLAAFAGLAGIYGHNHSGSTAEITGFVLALLAWWVLGKRRNSPQEDHVLRAAEVDTVPA